jgi:DNA repair exonuclease SbcCD nuclease subunit
VEGARIDEPDYPIARDAADRAGLDYLALGHFHSFATYPSAGGARMAYSGTHEPTRFGERDSGNAVVVELARPGELPVLTPVKTGALAWIALDAELREAGDVARVRERIEAVAAPGATLLRVRLSGLLAAREQDELLRVGELIESRFLFGRLESHGLRPSPTDAEWLDALPAGIVREAARRLALLADPSHTGTRPDDASPDVAAWALLELYQLALEAEGETGVGARESPP